MCGICGAIDFSESANAAEVVRLMTPTMQHRGPDDEGYLDRGPLSLGMRRLSIIDVEGGHQPIFNEDGTIGAVLNGEIYNFQELQEQLKDRGHTFRTRSDSEVIAHAYEEWRAQCVERFQGMFALAVWDGRKKREVSKEEKGKWEEVTAGRLFLARDRLGIKPLYYYAQGVKFRVSSSEFRVKTETIHSAPETSPLESELETRNSKLETFLFASEVRTLLASGAVPRKLSKAAVESYLLFGSVSEPMTVVEGILSLPPGHHMTIALGSKAGSLNIQRYWNIAEAGRADAETRGRGDGETGNGHAIESTTRSAAKRVRSLLEQSVRSHLIADVPVGVFLSSGIDSTALAALASREVSGVHTFTVAFPEDKFSEATIARRTAARLGTTHREVMLSGDETLARLGEAVGALDLPTMDGINTYFVSAGA